MAREYMCAYYSLLETAKRLTDSEFGRLMRAAIAYSASGETPTLSGRELLMWDMVKWQVDRDNEKFRAFTEKQAENGRKGGRPKKFEETQKTQAFSEKPKKTKTTTTNDKQKAYHNPLTPLEGAIAEFKAHRSKLRKPMTDRAVQLFRDRLQQLAPSNEQKQIELINTAIERGWMTVYVSDEKPKGKARSDYPQRPFDASEYEDLFLGMEAK